MGRSYGLVPRSWPLTWPRPGRCRDEHHGRATRFPRARLASLLPVVDRSRRTAIAAVKPEPRALPPADLAPRGFRPAAGRFRAADLTRPARARPDDGRALR